MDADWGLCVGAPRGVPALRARAQLVSAPRWAAWLSDLFLIAGTVFVVVGVALLLWGLSRP